MFFFCVLVLQSSPFFACLSSIVKHLICDKKFWNFRISLAGGSEKLENQDEGQFIKIAISCKISTIDSKVQNITCVFYLDVSYAILISEKYQLFKKL